MCLYACWLASLLIKGWTNKNNKFATGRLVFIYTPQETLLG